MKKAIWTGLAAAGLMLSAMVSGCGEPFGCDDPPFAPIETLELIVSPESVVAGEPVTIVTSFEKSVFSDGSFFVHDWDVDVVDATTGGVIGTFEHSKSSIEYGFEPNVSGVVLGADIVDDRSMEVTLEFSATRAPGPIIIKVDASNGDVHCNGLVRGAATFTVADGSKEPLEAPDGETNDYEGAPLLLDVQVLVDGADLLASFDPEESYHEVVIEPDVTEFTVALDVEDPTAEVEVNFDGDWVTFTGEPLTFAYPDSDGRPFQTKFVRIDLTAGDGSTAIYSVGVRRFAAAEPACPVATDWAPLLKYASKRSPGDRFGHDVAVDCHTLAVSATREDSCSTTDQSNNDCLEAGAVYVASDLGRQPRQYVKASNPGAGDEFGYRIDVDGDLLAVGAPFEDGNAQSRVGSYNDGADGAGAVYLFRRFEGEWIQVAYLKASNAEAGDEFGMSVAVSGDRVAVGARGEDSFPGAVYVFERIRGNWEQTAHIRASNANAGDAFGRAVDFDWPLLIVGAPLEASNARGVNGDEDNNDYSLVGAGAAYIFENVGQSWYQRAYLKQSNTDNGDGFGRAVAIDGYTAVVGAWGEDSRYSSGTSTGEADNGALSAGAAYVYEFNREWRQTAYLKASNPDAQDWFGSSVDIDGDLIVVGAHKEDSSTRKGDNDLADVGAVYPYRRSGNTWTYDGYLKMTGPEGEDLFGYSVAVSGTIIAAGAPQDDFVGPDTGSAWVFQ